MNVVLLPALASLAAVRADALPCMSGTCLFGWLWLTAALTLLSVWVVRDWQSGGNDKAVRARRLVPATATARTTNAAALMPRPSDVAPRARASSSSPFSRPLAGLALADLAVSPDLRASSTTDMAAAPPVRTSRISSAGRSFPPRRPLPRSPGTPTVPDSSGLSGQNPPA